MEDDLQLVQRMIDGDERAFERFADDYIPVLYRFVSRRLGGDRELTREIVQTTVCKVMGKLASFRGESTLVTWLCACCRNEIAGHFRRKARPYQEVDLELEDMPSPGGPEHRALQRERARLVHEVLDTVPPRYGKALEWKYLEKVSVREIAKRLGVGPKAAESLLTRARVAFRKRYEALVSEGRADSGGGEAGPLGAAEGVTQWS